MGPRFFRSLVLILLATPKLLSAESLTIRFDDLATYVKAGNQYAKAGDGLVEAARHNQGYLKRSYLPRLKFEAGGEHFQTGPNDPTTEPFGSVAASLNLYRGGRDHLEDQSRKYHLDGAEIEAQDIYLRELFKGRREFWRLVYQRELMVFLREALSQNDKNLAAAKRRLNAGMGSVTDRYEFEFNQTELAQHSLQLALAESNSQRRLAVLLGLDPQTSLLTESVVAHKHDDELFNVTLTAEQHREIKKLWVHEQLALTKRAQAKLWWLPSVDLFGSYALHTYREREYFDQDDRFESVVGGKIGIELFDGLQAHTEAAVASIQAAAISQQRSQSQRELEADFSALKQQLKLDHELLHGTQENVERARQYLTGTISEYGRGQKNSPDVLGAARRFLDAQRRFAEIKLDYQLARCDLLAMLGR